MGTTKIICYTRLIYLGFTTVQIDGQIAQNIIFFLPKCVEGYPSIPSTKVGCGAHLAVWHGHEYGHKGHLVEKGVV